MTRGQTIASPRESLISLATSASRMSPCHQIAHSFPAPPESPRSETTQANQNEKVTNAKIEHGENDNESAFYDGRVGAVISS